MTICPDTVAPAEAIPVNVYQAIGGRAAVTAAVDGFYQRLLADPALSGFSPAASPRGTVPSSSRSSVRRWAVPSATGTRPC